jgi:protein-S-isoprenylcysteine O-methyltransferase Ste14
MPEMQPVLGLHRFWWPGEMVMAGGLLMPSLWLAKWTAHGERTGLRCAMLVPAFGGVFLGVPLLVELGGMNELADHWRRFAPISRSLIAITAVMLSIPGLAAVRDLARSGHGTPVPLDPPQRLVTHGIYAYLRNPMQLSMTALLLLEAWFVGSFWPLVLAAMGVVYSEGIARWSENRDMWERFGEAWKNYHRSVRPWRPRWLPRAGEPCELWLDDRCGPCSEIAIWFQKRNPIDLKLLRSSQWQGPELNRVTWRHAASNRTETGVAAIAMALQHLNLFWAAVGWTAGLPGICHVLQIYFDAVGAGKRVRANC